jgi:tetratricopeptide (TPR) repeat protein
MTQLSGVNEISEEAIGAAAFSCAAGAGLLDACRLYIAQHEIPSHKLPVFYCRLGEALLHNGRREDAVDCARIAFELRPEEEEIINVCAWVFSNCGRYEQAGAAYEQLLEIRRDWAEGHRHASGSFAAAGQLERAIFHACTASDLDPYSVEFAVHAACQYEAAGRYEDAVVFFTRAAALRPADSSLLRQLSGAKFALGQCDEAVALALHALSLAPNERLNALHTTELLLRTGQLDKAADVIHDTVVAYPHDAVAWRLLSATQMLRGRAEEALDAIERALAITSDTAEYHLHRANLLYRLGRLDDAAEAFGQAAALDPSNPDAKRSQLTVFYDSGRFTEALAIGGELIRASPENEEYAQAVLQVLNRRFEALDGDYVVLSERSLRPHWQPRPPPGFFEALQTQTRVIHALIIRETRTRFGDSKLGYGWALLEPILHILMLSLVFAVMMHGRPPIGDQFFIFYYTGIIPYHLFVHTSTSMTYAITSNGSLLRLPLRG